MSNQILKEQWVQWLDQLAEKEFVLIDNFLPLNILQSLEELFEKVYQKDDFNPAKVGSSYHEKRIDEIRSDSIYWLDKTQHSSIALFFELIHEMMQEISEFLFLSLQGYEFHFANYPQGGYYKAHLDQFKERNNRMISVVIYLNKNWENGMGGELKIHGENELLIEPIYNRAVIFRSDTILHEVLPTQFERKSLTGWLLKRPSDIGVLNY